MTTHLRAILLVTVAVAAIPSNARNRDVETSAVVVDELSQPFAVGFDAAGNMFVAEMTGQRILVREPGGAVRVYAGTGEKGFAGDGGPASAARFNGIHHILVTSAGDVLIADTWNNRVRKIDSDTGIITTIAGTGNKGYSGDGGPATSADFGAVYCLALDSAGQSLFIADLDNRRVRRIELTSGVVTTVAGNGQRGVPADGALAIEAPLVDPRAIAVDSAGNLYIIERSGHALRVVSRDGRIQTVAGTGKPGPCGDGGPALATAMNGPKHLCVDADGSVLIADTENHAVLRYLPDEGRLVRVAGTGKSGAGGVGGPLSRVELARPHGVFVHATGLYIADSDNGRILRAKGDSHDR